ncbi:hypothetical protein NLI96_g2856 [Meripilus lineatus]|uniref:Uncharacterized protein n=1 Tax=Meripilus lineatus TaxID=2056292 RepID=A0AAD5VA06_9APHY|nr:hypothetical protein NLI96_g2856 [Physisporinus lineatus]
MKVAVVRMGWPGSSVGIVALYSKPGSRSFLDYDLCERLRELSLREIPKTSTYAIDMVRFPLDWGTAQDSAEYVYKGAVPLKIWFCGEVQLNWLITTDGDPKSSVSLRINTLRESDQIKLEEILFDMSYPKVDREARNGVPAEIWAGRFMSKKNTPKAQIKLFGDIYDAREKNNKDRPNYSVHALKQGDVVMVETYIQRYRPSTKPNDQWKVKYQLKKLYVLYVGDDSGDAPGDVPDEDEDI